MKPYYHDAHVVIYHADVRDVSSGVIGPAACVVTSPPHHAGIDPDHAGIDHQGGDEPLPDPDYHRLAVTASELLRQVLARADGPAWVNIDVSRLHTWLDALHTAGLTQRHVVRPDHGIADTASGPWQSPSSPHRRHGSDAVVVACATGWERYLPEGINSQWRDRPRNWALLCPNTRAVRPRVPTTSTHPPVIPAEAAARAIRLSSWPGERVFDPFCGSGTTLLAARRLGRQAVGVDISERWCELAATRLARTVLEPIG